MQSVPRHISHFIRKSLSRHTDTPPLAEAILGLTEQRFKYFSHLVIPTQASITTLDWVVVRVDCIFLIHDCQDRHADLAHIQSLQEQWTATQQKALELQHCCARSTIMVSYSLSWPRMPHRNAI